MLLVFRPLNVIRPLLVAAATMAIATLAVASERTPAPEGAAVAIIQPANGATVASPVTVYFGLSGMGIAPAGVEWGDTGHHHLLIDMGEFASYDEAIPFDDNHRHFGGGQTQVTLDLPAGEHTLQLVLADWQHLPHDPPIVSERITITVE